MRRATASLLLAAALLAACDGPPPSLPASGSASPTATAAALDPDYSAFRQRVQAAPAQFIRFQRDFALDAAQGPGTIRATAARMHDWVEAERQAIAGFDRNGCFGEALGLYLVALTRSEEAADAYEELGGLASLPPEPGAAGDALRAAAQAVGEAESAANAALEDCR